MGTYLLPALALGVERPEPDIMKKPPRSMEERLLNLPTLARASGFLGPIKVLTGMIGYFWVLIHSSWHWGEILNYYDPVYQKATTMCLLAIVVTQIANDFVCRGAKESILNLGFFSNRLLLLGVGCEIVLGIAFVYFPPLQSILNPRALGINDWFLLIPFLSRGGEKKGVINKNLNVH